MIELPLIVLAVVLVAIVFDFVNGFHDAANSIATLVATGTMKPKHAVLWAAFFNFIAIIVFGTGVAKTVGSGMIAVDSITPAVILAGLLGAIIWGLTTWWFGIPTSSSHALLGGYAGSAMAYAALTKGFDQITSPMIAAGWTKTLIFVVVAPLIGMFVAHVLMHITVFAQKRMKNKKAEKVFGLLQMASSAFLSLMHGGNDAQKTAGIITGALMAGGVLTEFVVPSWVLVISYGAMGLGTLVGGWRIVNTLGRKLTRLKPNGGFSAETAAALSIMFATQMHLPISTTHVTTGAILGVGAARNVQAVRWSLAGWIVWAWVLTIPASAAVGGLCLLAVHSFGLL